MAKIMLHFFSYIYWDPSRAIFNFDLPLLGRPLLWYGFFFAIGFFAGYWILQRLIKSYLFLFPKIYPRDVLTWPELCKLLQDVSQGATAKEKIALAITKKLPSKERQKIREWKREQEIESELKQAITLALNEILEDKTLFSEWTSSLGKNLSRLNKMSLKASLMRNRLILESLLGPILWTVDQKTSWLAERFTFYVILGTLIGARLGDVFFYQNWSTFLAHPIEIIKVWQGGLASHGGALGIVIALYFFSKRLKKRLFMFSWLNLLDMVAISAGLTGAFIRIGNFFNQEILGKPSDLPWAVIFGHPADHSLSIPRHPVQLYESFYYFLVFIFLYCLWNFSLKWKKPGKICGLFFVLVFVFRFLIEFLKVEQSELMTSNGFLDMGQYLSLPFIFWGIYLLFFQKKH
jgi:phosphatidylglycerol---prolipoprotein diacylglyceryl transferase